MLKETLQTLRRRKSPVMNTRRAGPNTLPKLRPRHKRPPLTRSQVMARIRSRDTAPEVRVRSAAHALGLRFRKHVADLPGKPDLANRRRKWAIFVHGCFWHSHQGCRLASNPKSNSSYWAPKLQRNKERDRDKYCEMEDLGYRILVIWECETRDPLVLQRKLVAFFEASSPSHCRSTLS